jgi:hypothetical protein
MGISKLRLYYPYGFVYWWQIPLVADLLRSLNSYYRPLSRWLKSAVSDQGNAYELFWGLAEPYFSDTTKTWGTRDNSFLRTPILLSSHYAQTNPLFFPTLGDLHSHLQNIYAAIVNFGLDVESHRDVGSHRACEACSSGGLGEFHLMIDLIS